MTPLKERRKVLIVSESVTFFENISSLLPPKEFYPVTHAKSGGDARRKLLDLDADILIVDSPLTDEHGLLFCENFSTGNVGILLLVNSDIYEEISERAEEEGIVTLPKPNSPQMFYIAIKMLSAMTFRLAKMEEKARSLEEKMKDLRTVNKAKWLLIENKKMSESEAQHYIEKTAMDKRLSKREAADLIIDRFEV